MPVAALSCSETNAALPRHRRTEAIDDHARRLGRQQCRAVEKRLRWNTVGGVADEVAAAIVGEGRRDQIAVDARLKVTFDTGWRKRADPCRRG